MAHTAAFLAELIADPLLQRHLSAVVVANSVGGQRAATLQALSLIYDAIYTAASGSPSPLSLCAAQHLLQ
jgi:hypothetical protein